MDIEPKKKTMQQFQSEVDTQGNTVIFCKMRKSWCGRLFPWGVYEGMISLPSAAAKTQEAMVGVYGLEFWVKGAVAVHTTLLFPLSLSPSG